MTTVPPMIHRKAAALLFICCVLLFNKGMSIIYHLENAQQHVCDINELLKFLKLLK